MHFLSEQWSCSCSTANVTCFYSQTINNQNMKKQTSNESQVKRAHTRKIGDCESDAANYIFFCFDCRGSASMQPCVCHVCLCEFSLSPSLLQEDSTEPWYRRTQWGGSSAWLASHSRNGKRDFLPEGQRVCVRDILFQLGTQSPLCHQGQWCNIMLLDNTALSLHSF